jgi:hypothetical protein
MKVWLLFEANLDKGRGIPADFVTEVGNNLPGSEVFKEALSNFSINYPVCINANGTITINPVYWRDYNGNTGFVTNNVEYTGIGEAKITMATSPAYYY